MGALQPPDRAGQRVYTIGYGGRDINGFLALVQAQEPKIATIVDVRLRPDRASMGIWVKAKTPDKGIERWLTEAGLGYRSIIELGNLFLGYESWRGPYRELLKTSGKLLVARLPYIPGPICLLCAERQVSECHRRLIAQYLAEHQGADICHLE